MKCKKCSSTSVIKLRQHNVSYCEYHFNEYFEKRVEKTIIKYGMCKPEDRILVAVSGGKDSSVLLYVLDKMGYRVDGVFVDTGTVTPPHEELKQLQDLIRGQVYYLDIRDYFLGLTIPEVSKILRRSTCSVCGTARRYILNRYALIAGYNVLAMGHNLDDECAVLLGNVLNWHIGYLSRQKPVLHKTHPGFVKKIKPLVLLTEREIYAYALLNHIPCSKENCPFSKNASSLRYKSGINKVERYHPGTKLRFYTEFVKKSPFEPEKVTIKSCSVCGYPTTEDICAFCRMKARVKNALGK